MDLNVDEIEALLQAGGYTVRVRYLAPTDMWEATIHSEYLPQTKGIRSPSKETAVQVAYKFFIGETK